MRRMQDRGGKDVTSLLPKKRTERDGANCDCSVARWSRVEKVGRVDGGEVAVSFAIQSDGVSVVERAGSVAAHAMQAVRAVQLRLELWAQVVIAMISSSPVGRRG